MIGDTNSHCCQNSNLLSLSLYDLTIHNHLHHNSVVICCIVSPGALVTAGVLTAGLISFRYGNSQLGQKLMRARVVAQGATVALMIGSAYYYGDQIKLFKKGSSP